MVDGYRRKQKRRANEIIQVSWYTAVLSRQKEIPPLSQLLQDEDSPKHEQTDDEMLAMCKMLNAAFGGTVVET